MVIVILCLFTAAIFGSTPVPRGATHAPLRVQVKSYHTHFSHGYYEGMWKMSSKGFKDRNENNKEKYVSDLKEHGFGRVKARVLGVRIDGKRAEVTVRISIWTNQDKKWTKEVVLEQWVFEDGGWCFDNQLPQTKT